MEQYFRKKMDKLTASDIFRTFPASTTYVNPPVTQSLINYIPSSMGGSFFDSESVESISKKDEELDELEEAQKYFIYDDERCHELWRAFRDAAGPWMSHRFILDEWETHKPKGQSKCDLEEEMNMESFDGVLTKEMVAPNLYRVDRSPEFQHYAFTKCVLVKMKLTDIDVLKTYQYLQNINVSSNKLTTLKPLGNLPFLKILEASHNLLSTVLDFKAPYFLTMVNLSYNKIKVMRDISDFWSITDLNLSHNFIKVIVGIQELWHLTTLNLSNNRIETIENLGFLRIQFLYLQNNTIKLNETDEKANLHNLRNIRIINLSNNLVSSLKVFETVENLECLDVVNNNVSKLLDIYYLRNLKYLHKLNLSGNPVTDIKRYGEVCVTHIKRLLELDDEPIDSDVWLEKLSNVTTDVSRVAAHSRLKLLILEQLNPPQMSPWILPYNCSPIAVIVLVGLHASNRAYIARKFCANNKNVTVGIPYTTKPKHKNEVQGDYFYYVDEKTFMTMLKNGEFFTYQENLGSYYGIAHSEFKKAENGIIMFYTDMTMALAIRRKLLNTILVLSLPSTTQVHLQKLSKLFSVQNVDKHTLKIVNSPVVAAEYRLQFAEQKNKLLSSEIHTVLTDMLMQVCTRCDEGLELPKSKEYVIDEGQPPTVEQHAPAPLRLSTTDANKLDKSDIFQLWWASTTTDTLSMVIHPSHTNSVESKNFYKGDLEPLSKVNMESAQNTTQMKRYVSFTVAHIHKIENYKDSSDPELQNDVSEIDSQEGVDQESTESSVNTIELRNTQSSSPDTETESTSYSPTPCRKVLKDYDCYVDMLKNDARIKEFFDGELRQRDELLELHLEMPGLFREMLFTDKEEEIMDKLQALVNDILRYRETSTKTILNLKKDKNFKRLTHDKITNYFKELRQEVSTSEKQAEEFIGRVKSQRRVCEDTFCEDPSCPVW